MRNNLSENYPQFRHALSKILASPVVGRKSFENIGLKGRKTISLSGAPTCLGRALSLVDLLCAFLLPSECKLMETCCLVTVLSAACYIHAVFV